MGATNSTKAINKTIGCPVVDKNEVLEKEICPVKQYSEESTALQYNPTTNDFKFDQNMQPFQTTSLSITRVVSSIPKSEEVTPSHQPTGVDKWVYPSEQQYFNAMKRKGYNPEERDISVILAIHNLVNEQGWTKIKEWESLRGNLNPKLKSFTGRPKDISPKALFSNWILG